MLFSAFFASAQNVDEMLEIADKERSRLLELSEEYRNDLRRKWMEYVSSPWVDVEPDKPLQRPLEDHPDIQVMPLESYDYNVGETFEIPSSVLHIDKGMYAGDYFADFPVFRETTEGERQISVLVNGYELLIRFPDIATIILEDISEAEIASVLNHMLDNSYLNTLRDLSCVREILSLSDWSFVKMVENLSAMVYGSKRRSEAILLQAYILNEFGFRLCLGSGSDGNLYKLMTADAYLYDFTSLLYDGQRYYLIDDRPLGSGTDIKLIPLPFESKRSMRMRMNPDEKFCLTPSKDMKYVPSRYPNLFMEVTTDMSRMEFYAEYPMFCTEEGPLSTYYHYASMPLSEEVRNTVYPVLKQAVAGRSELEAVNILLNVVQTSFDYVEDDRAWGCERYFFPDELWRYGEGDCEDKSILFSRLVRDILGLEVALVYWPGHLSSAVVFSDEVKGAYFNVNGSVYVSCDPTYENAYVGAVMDKYKEQNAELILL